MGRRKYKYYVVEPFGWKTENREKALEMFHGWAGRSTSWLCGVTFENEYVELKSKY